MTNTKKRFEENLQEVRNKNHNKLRFLRRQQQDQEAVKELKEYANRKAKS